MSETRFIVEVLVAQGVEIALLREPGLSEEVARRRVVERLLATATDRGARRFRADLGALLAELDAAAAA
jgi:hypothetical protein